jgi:hypothetical protein
MAQADAAGGNPSAKQVWRLEPYRPFPVDALPALIQQYVCQGATALGCDPAYLALPALAVAAGVIGYTRVLRLKRTWREAAEGEMAAAYSKLEAYAARFALVHHVLACAWLETDDRREVGLKSVEAGITLARWFAHEARRIYTTLSESTEQREARRLAEFIQARGGRISVRQLMRANCRRYPDAEAAEAALAGLVEAGLAG